MKGIRAKLGVGIIASYFAVAALQAWPLPLHMSTRLTGSPGGDTGVYVWNIWVFRHEIIDGHEPFETNLVLPLEGPTDLSLHNYTVFSDLLALPLLGYLGVVTTFNVIYLINTALAGIGMFLLARRLTGRTIESWLAGVLFCCSPFLVARGSAHFSLAAAAPLPFFAYWFDRAWTSARPRDGAAAGAMIAWAGFSDPYYAIYCVMLGALIAASRLVDVEIGWRTSVPRRARGLLDAAMALDVLAMLAVHVAARGVLTVAGVVISMHSLYTPVLALTVLAIARALVVVRVRVTWRTPAMARRLLRAGVAAVGAAALLLAPELYALALRVLDGRTVPVPVLWRSSAPGLDLLSFLLPNPNHPLAPAAIASWLSRRPGRYEENVASLSFVALAVIAAAWRSARFRPSRLWTVVTLGFLSLALGPFLQIAGVNTYIPTPWTLVRYVPVIDQARMPPRFAVMAMLGFAVIFASALAALGDRFPRARRWLVPAIGLALAFELLPVPRPLYSAQVPAIYRTVAADPRPVRVLELPFGVRDGLSSLGNFTAASQFYQTVHAKALIGGYLSRVEDSTKTDLLDMPVPDALIALSEGRTPPASLEARARATADAFVAQSQIGYVVVDAARASPALRAFAIATLHLVPAGRSGSFELYTPAPTHDDARAGSGKHGV